MLLGCEQPSASARACPWPLRRLPATRQRASVAPRIDGLVEVLAMNEFYRLQL
jgi:hypothetical protein